MMVRLRPGAPLWLQNSGEYEKWRSLNEELEHDWGCSAQQSLLNLNLLGGREVNIVLSLKKISQEAPVYHI